MMLTALLGLFLLFGVVGIFLAISNDKRWFWAAGLFIYFVSFLGSWSIGVYTLSITFVLWALALGYSLKLIKKPYQAVWAILIGIVLWAVMIMTLDDYWWFLPFRIFA